MHRLQACLDAMGIDTDFEAFVSDHRRLLSDLDKDKNAQREILYHAALGHELRYKLYHILGKGEYCLTVLAHIVKKSKSTMSHHLSILERAGLIIGRRRGLYTVYSSVGYFYEKRVEPVLRTGRPEQ
ncbi:MAG: winged helix-turn-helix transcriptional regulator [Candidatus Thorarchaeota archaeon]|nr:winged helix-turn-helix transcriptional regulator [Candidatus Thorarchaeota archaeon]